ncbi:MAG TPA: LD-carboxypeptidase [Terracidiphilus sp.]|jgi:muramoyltetrapeptide carboxypeptidase|nr:LD-carboxypeptidase [Terracidiphilus sp.]
MARPTSLIQMPPVEPGAGIAVIAPASFAREERVERGLAALHALGYAPKLGAGAAERGPLYFAGTAARRLAGLHAAFEDPAAGVVMSLRGGYGSNYLLDGLDIEKIARHPKPFFAYSDLTGVQLRLLDAIGLIAFHGPMLAADFCFDDGVHLPSFVAALRGDAYSAGEEEGLRALQLGSARGMLYGGCLSIVVSLLGTPWEPRTEGRLLFLEDVGVKPYQVDRMLWQLRKAGKLDGVPGIVFGEMLDCVSPGAAPGLLEEAILSALDGFDGPIAMGLRSGHVSRQNVTLRFGAEAELTSGQQTHLHLFPPQPSPAQRFSPQPFSPMEAQ